jgi:hypothetical protein
MPEVARQRANQLFRLGMAMGMERGTSPHWDQQQAAAANAIRRLAQLGDGAQALDPDAAAAGPPREKPLPNETTAPREDDDWNALEPLVRRLLTYMRGRERADLADLCNEVWGKHYAHMTDNSIHTAICKANSFLLKKQCPRQLHKSRGEPQVRWE